MATDEKPQGSAPPVTAQPTKTPAATAGAASPAPQAAGVPSSEGVKPSVATNAPAVATNNPFRVRRKQLEAQLKQQEQDKSRHAAHAKATTAAMLAELKDQEARFGQSGLSPLTPRGNLLVAGEIAAQYPDDHLRWVNETIPGRAALLQSMGYERVPGQVKGGDTVLWKIPREKWASGEVAKNVQTEKMLRKATSQNRDDTVQELQTFFDQHGVNIDVDKFFSREA